MPTFIAAKLNWFTVITQNHILVRRAWFSTFWYAASHILKPTLRLSIRSQSINDVTNYNM